MKKSTHHTSTTQKKSSTGAFFRKRQTAASKSDGPGVTVAQTNTRVSRPGDPYEMEADKMAKRVVERPQDAHWQRPIFHEITPLVGLLPQRVPDEEYRGVQTKADEGVQEMEDNQRKMEGDESASPVQSMEEAAGKKDQRPAMKGETTQEGPQMRTEAEAARTMEKAATKEEQSMAMQVETTWDQPQKHPQAKSAQSLQESSIQPQQEAKVQSMDEAASKEDPEPAMRTELTQERLQTYAGGEEPPHTKQQPSVQAMKRRKSGDPPVQKKAVPEKAAVKPQIQKTGPSQKKVQKNSDHLGPDRDVHQKKEERTAMTASEPTQAYRKLQKTANAKDLRSKADTSPQTRSVGKQPGGGVSLPSLINKKLMASKGQGSPLPEPVRQEMEMAFGADFGAIRIHTDATAVDLSKQLRAQAFAHGRDVYFNTGKFDPYSRRGKFLLAHELTHTIQQGAAPSLAATAGQGAGAKPLVQRDLLDDIVDNIVDLIDSIPGYGLSDIIAYIPGYDMLCYLLEYDFLRQQRVEPTNKKLIEGLMGLVPGGKYVYQRLDERGIVDDAVNWVSGEMNRLDLSMSRVTRVVSEIWDLSDIWEGVDWNLRLIKRKFDSLYNDVVSFAGSLLSGIVKMIKDAFLDLLVELARELEGYDLLADLLGKDPISGEERNASTEDILRGILKLPVIQAIGGDKLLKKLDEHNKLKEAADWIDAQWALLKGSFNDLLNIATKFLDAFTVETLQDPMGFVNGIKEDVVSFITKITTFFKNLADKALELIQEVSLWLLDNFISKDSPAWDLVVFVFGKNPVTGKAVARDYLKLIGAFLKMLPNGDSLYAKFIETGALQQMVDWVSKAITEFITIIRNIKDSFIKLWEESSIDDLFEPVPFFKRMFDLFKQPITKLLAFVKDVIVKLFKVLAFIMNIPEDVVKQIIDNVVSAYEDIKKDPVKFLLNLLRAVKEGFSKFFKNILKHLLDGVTGWMFGKLSEAGITIPKTFDLPSLLNLVLEILGLTMDNLWERLALQIGPEKVAMIRGAIDKLKGIWEFIKDVKKNGISAIWKYIKEKVKDFWNMILESAKEWIITKIVEKVTTKLLSMLDPTGVMAVVNGFIAFYKAVETLVEQLNAMLKIVASFTKGMAEIAKGAVNNAATFLEQTLAKALPVAIAFLANQVGLGGISEKIREVIQKIRAYVNKGIDWLIGKAIKGMKSIMGLFTGKGKMGDTKEDKKLKNVDPKDHNKIAGMAVVEMEKPVESAKNYDDLRAAKVKQAVEVERTYTGLLTQGIKLKVKFVDKHSDAKDNDLDFKVVIAPNDEVEDGSVGVSGEFESKIFQKGDRVTDVDQKDRSPVFIVTHFTREKGTNLVWTRPITKEYKGTKLGKPESGLKKTEKGPSKYRENGKLLHEYRGSKMIRPTFYRVSYANAKAELLKENQDPQNSNNFLSQASYIEEEAQNPTAVKRSTSSGYRASLPESVAAADHYNPYSVARHWNNIGHDCLQFIREIWYNDKNSLRIISRNLNSKWGRSEPRYQAKITENFRGPDE